MKRRLISVMLAAVLTMTLLSGGVTSAAGVDYGLEGLTGSIAVRVTSNGASVSKLETGEIYSLQFWLQDICPYSITLPVCWDPEVLQVVDPETGEPVESGKKASAAGAGFRAGPKCYEVDYDYSTREMRPLYWNGKPVFSQMSDGGYPYLDAEAGAYRFAYFVMSPTKPLASQLFLEIYFKAVGSGDPDLHIATKRTDPDRYDETEPDGLVVLTREDGGAKTTVLTDQVSFPAVRAYTPEELSESYDHPTPTPRPTPTPVPTYPVEPTPSEDPKDPEEPEPALVEAEHLTCFPYASVLRIAAVLPEIDGKPAADGVCGIPASSISQLLNERRGEAGGILADMPEQIPAGERYAVSFSLASAADMAMAGVPMLYLESPWGYVGLNVGLLAAEHGSDGYATVTVTPTEDGVQVGMTVDGEVVTGFSGPGLRLILPLRQAGADLPVSADVFGVAGREEPLSIYTVREDAVIFLSPSLGGFRLTEPAAERFLDTDAYPWAEEAIDALAARRIVSGVGDGLFDPGQSVSREQFAAMLVRAAGLYSAVATDGFPDVSGWSEDYVRSARAAGVVNGVGGGLFDPTAKIRREDLAVMLLRTAEQYGLQLEAVRGEPSFTDDGEIDGYARAAVYALYRAGIVSGKDGGRFDPHGAATRAEAAKMIYGLLPYFDSIL